MTDELEGDHIVEFTSAGPKNYGYITTLEKRVAKYVGSRSMLGEVVS